MDTVTLIRSAIRGLLRAAGAELAGELRSALVREDDYAAAGKPACDYDDPAAREELVDALARDARAVLGVLEVRKLDPEADRELTQAVGLLAAVTGQDLEQDEAGVFAIARRVAPDRVIPAVDPDAGMGTRPRPAALTGTKATSPSTPIRRSSPPARSPPATAGTPRPRRACWLTCCPVARPAGPRGPARLRAPAKIPVTKRLTAMLPTALAS
jgi:hypothetical protein